MLSGRRRARRSRPTRTPAYRAYWPLSFLVDSATRSLAQNQGPVVALHQNQRRRRVAPEEAPVAEAQVERQVSHGPRGRHHLHNPTLRRLNSGVF